MCRQSRYGRVHSRPILTALVRFERRGTDEWLATRNHPTLAAIYGIEDAPSCRLPIRALVCRNCEGETLAARLPRVEKRKETRDDAGTKV